MNVVSCRYSEGKQGCCLLHAVCDLNIKRTSALAALTSYTLGCCVLQCLIMLPYTFGNAVLSGRKIIELIDHGNIDINGTGLAVTAVGTLSGIGM